MGLSAVRVDKDLALACTFTEVVWLEVTLQGRDLEIAPPAAGLESSQSWTIFNIRCTGPAPGTEIQMNNLSLGTYNRRSPVDQS